MTPGGPFATFLLGQNRLYVSYAQGCDINDSVCLEGSLKVPTYVDMGSGTTGYMEVENGPSKVSTDMLLNVFLGNPQPNDLEPPGSKRRPRVPIDNNFLHARTRVRRTHVKGEAGALWQA